MTSSLVLLLELAAGHYMEYNTAHKLRLQPEMSAHTILFALSRVTSLFEQLRIITVESSTI